MIDPTRALGHILISDGLIVEAFPSAKHRTDVRLAPGIQAGAIVRDPESGRWRYDDKMRQMFGIANNPEFPTDGKAARALREHFPQAERARLHRLVIDEYERRGETLDALDRELRQRE